MAAFEYNEVKVLRVIDGDTVDLMIDMGFDIHTKQRFRLYGIDTPETRTKDLDEKAKGLEAKEWLINAITDKTITIQSILDKKGKFGRYLCIIKANGINLNESLVQVGLAKRYVP